MEILVGALAAWGFLMLIWTLVGVVLFPLKRSRDIRLTLVIFGKGAPSCLSRYIKAVLWLRNSGLIWWDVAVLTDRLHPLALGQAEELLEQAYYADVVSAEDLTDWMEV